jgi:hypothetical protein
MFMFHQLIVIKKLINILISSIWNQFGTPTCIYLHFQKYIEMHIKMIKHNIIILKYKNILMYWSLNF